MKMKLSAYLAVFTLMFALDVFSQSPPLLEGVLSDEGVFVVSVSVWGKDAETLSRKLKRFDGPVPDRFTVNLIGSVNSRRIIEVLPGGLSMKISGEHSAISIFSVHLFEYESARQSELTLTWTSTSHILFENPWDPLAALEGSGALLNLSGEGKLANDRLDGLNGKFKTIQQTGKEKLVALIMAGSTPIESLSDRRRLVGFFWEKNERRLIRVEEPAQRLEGDYEKKSLWADGISVKEWRLLGEPSKPHFLIEGPERRLKANEVLTSTGEIYPEPAVKAVQLSDGAFLVIRDWYGKGEQEAGLGSHLRAHLLGGYDLPAPLVGKPVLISKRNGDEGKSIAARSLEPLPSSGVNRLYFGSEGQRPPMVMSLQSIQSSVPGAIRRAEVVLWADERSSRTRMRSGAACSSSFEH